MANQEQLDLLKQGTEVWNTWRKQHPSLRPDLSEASLWGVNLTRADLSGADLSRASLRAADLSGATLSQTSLRDAYLMRANLSGANLSGADLKYALQPHLLGETLP